MERDWYFPSVSFVVLTVDQFVGDRNRITTFIQKLAYFP